ncbi:protein LURP-one-related 11-like [Aristolochia californica]|uniref:protein LURP-one-related 11-like n=1 Tax=Aristolochia californica TaxID=171875 RepID=UPI0035D96828
MAKVQPKPVFASSSSSYMTSRRESFTIWMKSLVFHGSGCTVFDSKGEIIYRIDNYNHKHNDRVFLMDLRGHVLFTLVRKKLTVLGSWEGYKSCDSSTGTEEKPSFKVSRPSWIFRRSSPCKVTVRWDRNQNSCHKIKKLKSGFEIVNPQGGLITEVKQKHSSSGVALGDDVLSMVVEPDIDHSLIMAIVVVYSLMNHNM